MTEGTPGTHIHTSCSIYISVTHLTADKPTLHIYTQDIFFIHMRMYIAHVHVHFYLFIVYCLLLLLIFMSCTVYMYTRVLFL